MLSLAFPKVLTLAEACPGGVYAFAAVALFSRSKPASIEVACLVQI